MRAKYDSIPDNTELSSSPYDSDVSRSTVATPCPSDSNSVATPHQMENATPNSQHNRLAPTESVSPYQFRRWCGIRRSTCLLSIYICSYFSYLLGGAYLMLWLEAGTEKSLRIEAIKRKSDFMMKNPSINGKNIFYLQDLFHHFIKIKETRMSYPRERS